MRVCLSCVEIFAWGKYGGFGRATRTIGRELVKRGVEVFAVVPRRAPQKEVEELDGMTVLGFDMRWPFAESELFKRADADIYHSLEPSLGTWLAMRAMPERKHIVTFQDARNLHDWKLEFERPSRHRRQVLSNYFYEHNPLAAVAVRRADAVYSQSESQIPKIKSMYRIDDVLPLHNPVDIPASIQKAGRPTIGWLNRLDRRKRPELFLDLAAKFPQVRFIVGGSTRDPAWDGHLRETYGALDNVEFVGFVDQFADRAKHTSILAESWIMANTATREALPTNAFLEAVAHRCALLASLDYQDGFASNFGYCALDQDFEKGLAWLLENGRWRSLGEKGQAHVREQYRTDLVIDQHLQAYMSVLAGQRVPLSGTQIDPGPDARRAHEDLVA